MRVDYYILGALIILTILVARQNALLTEIHDNVDDVGMYGQRIIEYVEKGAFDKILR